MSIMSVFLGSISGMCSFKEVMDPTLGRIIDKVVDSLVTRHSLSKYLWRSMINCPTSPTKRCCDSIEGVKISNFYLPGATGA